jgi:hypothetical protein
MGGCLLVNAYEAQLAFSSSTSRACDFSGEMSGWRVDFAYIRVMTILAESCSPAPPCSWGAARRDAVGGPAEIELRRRRALPRLARDRPGQAPPSSGRGALRGRGAGRREHRR